MSIVALAGAGASMPSVHTFLQQGPPVIATAGLIDAAGEKLAFIGRVHTPRNLAKTFNKIGFGFGTITKGGTTDIQVSVQDLLTTSFEPDEVVDQSFLVGNANIVSNTWFEGTLGATRAVSSGTELAVVFEFSTFNVLDSIIIKSLGTSFGISYPYSASKSPTWVVNVGALPNIALGFDDGTYGYLEGGGIFTTSNTHTYNNASTPDEHALVISNPVTIVVNGFWILGDLDGNCDIVLYEGTTAMTGGTVTLDLDHRANTTVGRVMYFPFPNELTLVAGTTYYLAVKPTTATSINIYSVDVNAAAYWQPIGGGADWGYSTRTDGGSWAATTTTRRLVLGLQIVGWDGGSARIIGG